MAGADIRYRPRDWGPWTEIKLEALGSYLEVFNMAAKRAPRRVYFDLFAGGVANINRSTGEYFMGSAERALSATPGFTDFYFIELEAAAANTLHGLVDYYRANRNVSVVGGDCNVVLPRLVRQFDRHLGHAPSFAFVDQYAAEVHWTTLKALAGYKPTIPTELWLYFGDSLYPRGLGARDFGADRFADKLDLMFGSDAWRPLKHRRDRGEINGTQFKDGFVNLMRWQLENKLGYTRTIPLQVPNSKGQGIYTMIFATSHEAGNNIMNWVLSSATERFKRMTDEATQRRRLNSMIDQGQGALFAEYVPGTKPKRKPKLEEVPPPVKPDWL